ncbi:PEP-utilizing enzyme [Micromonospora sp. M12]
MAATTDPGWTPLFLTAGALVTETGAIMAHGPTVAREYGIPPSSACRTPPGRSPPDNSSPWTAVPEPSRSTDRRRLTEKDDHDRTEDTDRGAGGPAPASGGRGRGRDVAQPVRVGATPATAARAGRRSRSATSV